MGDFSFNIPKEKEYTEAEDYRTAFNLYEMVFGYRAAPYPMGELGIPIPNAERFSRLGVALFGADKSGNEGFLPVRIRYKGRVFSLPYSTISIQSRKVLKKTAMIKRRGEAIELIQTGAYVFTIQGIAINRETPFPENEITDLRDIYEINDSVELENAFSEIFLSESNKVVIESFDLPDMKGVSGAQSYSFKVISDTVLTLEVE